MCALCSVQGGGGVVGTATTQQSFFGNTYYSGRCYSWFYCVLSHSLIVYLLYSPSITFEVGFYADPIRVKDVSSSIVNNLNYLKPMHITIYYFAVNILLIVLLSLLG